MGIRIFLSVFIRERIFAPLDNGISLGICEKSESNVCTLRDF